MDAILLPPPDELRRRIAACEAELKSLRRLLRASQDAHDAEAARRRRAPPATPAMGGPTDAA
jgi:hypothetical protein